MDLTAVPGVPETALGAEDAAVLAEAAPPAPWRLELGAVMWLSWPGRGAARHLSPALRAGARVLLAGGGLVRYADTPVGPYAEALAVTVVVRDGRVALHVPFMAVDSARSVVGGRRNWSLPKVLARFEGEPSAGTEMSAHGEAGRCGWRAPGRTADPVPRARVPPPAVARRERSDGTRPARGHCSPRADERRGARRTRAAALGRVGLAARGRRRGRARRAHPGRVARTEAGRTPPPVSEALLAVCQQARYDGPCHGHGRASPEPTRA